MRHRLTDLHKAPFLRYHPARLYLLLVGKVTGLVVEHRSVSLRDLQVLLLLYQGKDQLYPRDLPQLLSGRAMLVSV